jgi:hypothetical protein
MKNIFSRTITWIQNECFQHVHRMEDDVPQNTSWNNIHQQEGNAAVWMPVSTTGRRKGWCPNRRLLDGPMLRLNITALFSTNFHNHFVAYLLEMKHADGSKDNYGSIILRSVVWPGQPWSELRDCGSIPVTHSLKTIHLTKNKTTLYVSPSPRVWI